MNKIHKNVLTTLIFILWCLRLYAAPTSIIVQSGVTEINIPDGNKMKVFNFLSQNSLGVIYYDTAGRALSMVTLVIADASPSNTEHSFQIMNMPDTIVGPAKLRISPRQDAQGDDAVFYLSYEITAISGYQSPFGMAVIPNNSTGNYSVILEATNDLITWSPAYSGAYHSESENRFFRVRISKN